MKTIIQGKNVVKKYELVTNAEVVDGVRVYNSKPELLETEEVTSWDVLFEITGEIKYNTSRSVRSFFSIVGSDALGHINLSETEEVSVMNSVYRADLDAEVLFTNKVISLDENTGERDKLTKKLCKALKEYNAQMISADAKLLAYCKLHKLNIEETDLEELLKVVYAGADEVELADLGNTGMFDTNYAMKQMERMCNAPSPFDAIEALRCDENKRKISLKSFVERRYGGNQR